MHHLHLHLHLLLCILLLQCLHRTSALRLVDRHSLPSPTLPLPSDTAVFALGSFWRSEPAFACFPGVLRTTAGYCGGSKLNPEYRNTGDHAESVEVEFDPQTVRYEQLLDIFWSSHDPTQVFGQGPDVGDQYRSVIFVRGPEQARLASLSKEREEAKLTDGALTTEIQSLGLFYPAEPEHQKFELRRNVQLMQLLGNVAEEEFSRSHLASRLNAYAAGMCPLSAKKAIDNMLNSFLRCKPKLQLVVNK